MALLIALVAAIAACSGGTYNNTPALDADTSPTSGPCVSPSPGRRSITAVQTLFCQKNTVSGIKAAGTAQPSSPGYVVRPVSSPSISGKSTLLEVVPSTSHFSDVLFYSPHLASPSPMPEHAVWRYAYYIDQPVWKSGRTVMEALEFDFNYVMPGWAYNFSSQCVFPAAGITETTEPYLDVWGGGTTKWVKAGVACKPKYFAPNVWHHAAWTYRWNLAKKVGTYVNLTIDGDPVTPPGWTRSDPITQDPPAKETFLEVQFQQDMLPQPPANAFHEWVDQVSLSYW